MEGRRNYTRKDMERWAASLVDLPEKINNLNFTIEKDKADLKKLEDELQQLLQNEIAPAKLQLEKIIAKIELPTLPAKIDELDTKHKDLTDQQESLHFQLQELKNKILPIQEAIIHIERLIEIKKILSTMQEINRASDALTHSRDSANSQLTILGNNILLEKRIVGEKESAKLTLRIRQQQLVADIEHVRHTSHIHAAPVSAVSVASQANAVTTTQIAMPVTTAVSYGQAATVYPVNYASNYQDPLSQELRQVEVSIQSLKIEITHHENQCRQFERDMRNYRSTIDRTNSELSKLKANKNGLQHKLNKLGAQAQDGYNDLQSLQYDLTSKQQILAPLNSKKEAIMGQLRTVNQMLSSNNYAKENTKKRMAECESLVEHFVPKSQSAIEQQRDEQMHLIANLEKDQNNRQDAIRQLKTKIDRDSSALRNTEDTLDTNQNNSFLNALKYNPQALVKKLLADLKIAITRYEAENPSGQSYLVRLCLAELRYKLPFIQNLALRGLDIISIERDRYFLICGLIQDIYDRTSRNDRAFSEILANLLRNNDVSAKESHQDYQNLKQDFPNELSDLSLTELAHREATMFRDTYDVFKVSLNRVNLSIEALRKVKTLGQNLLDDLDRKIAKADESHQFDYKYYANLLMLSSQLLDRPNDNALHTAFRNHVAHHADETPSVWNKIGGVAMLLLGAVMTAGAVLVAVLGFPIGAPLYASIPVGVAGAGLMLGGAALLYRGCKKGLPAKAEEFVNSVNENKHQQIVEAKEMDKLLSGEAGSYGLMDESSIPIPSAPGL